jgi:uncharacterized radical SAM protein YgiQ
VSTASRFLPTTRDEMDHLGWDLCDIVLITGDAYVDHPSFGTALIGRHLESLGWRVGVIPQPDWNDPEDFLRLGLPRLFVGVGSGAMDSMVNHYTSLGKPRSEDAYSEGGEPGRRPDRAVLRYVNCVQQVMPGVPVIIGGIEASLRRLSHYDFWSGKVRKSLLLDSKADLLVFGMGESAVAEAATRLSTGLTLAGIPGTAVTLGRKAWEAEPRNGIELPPHEAVIADPAAFMHMTKVIERENNPWCGSVLSQVSDSRVVVVQPPAEPLTPMEMDRLYALPFAGRPHPSYRRPVPAFEMIRSSITVVRGCAGGCSFCGLGLHQGRFITSRSPGSVLAEIRKLRGEDGFRGTITDLGGPTANMYGLGGSDEGACRTCRRNSCLDPGICGSFATDHGRFISLLRAVRAEEGVKHVFISSGVRFDLALRSVEFIRELAGHHVSGYLKIAPEHFSPEVLERMRKPGVELWREFLVLFRRFSKEAGREQFVVPYLMAAFPGCTEEHMRLAAEELKAEGIRPDKAQVFLPTPMTMATAIYLTGLDPRGAAVSVARKPSEKSRQLAYLQGAGGHS